MLIRPATIIVMIAFWAVLFFREIEGLWQGAGDGLDDGLCLCRIGAAVNHQKVVPTGNKKGWLKDRSCLSNLELGRWGTTKKI